MGPPLDETSPQGQPAGASSIMAQRTSVWNAADDFPTPPWATRALMEYGIQVSPTDTVWEPCCNRGYMARPLMEYFGQVWTSDKWDYGWFGQQQVADFLDPSTTVPGPVDWIVMNPPFNLAEQFYHKALQTARVGVALLVRLQFLEGASRYASIYADPSARPDKVLQFVERVPMVQGRYNPKASTATAYCWLVRGTAGGNRPEVTQLLWIPPCRKALVRDYDTIP
jgi:hypothetical protein